MKISDYLKPDRIFTDFRAENKKAALNKLCLLTADFYGLDYDSVAKVVGDREALGSTGLGGFVALPHGKSPDIESPVLIMALARQGIDFESIDGLPVKIFVLLLSPKNGDGGEHLQLLAGLGRLLKTETVVAEILSAADADEVYKILLQRD